MLVSRRFSQAFANNLADARRRAAEVANSAAYSEFVEMVRTRSPWRFAHRHGQTPSEPTRFLRGVDHHLENFVPKLLPCVDRKIQTVFDFGCGSGSSAVSLAMVLPEIQVQGVDIQEPDIAIARQRAAIYGVEGRCRFEKIGEGETLSFPDNSFDLCTSCSVLEYIIDPALRRTCVQELARITKLGGMLFITVPNKIYPIEIHSGKLGWNYFPHMLDAKMVGSHFWEIRRLARPHILKLHQTSMLQLLSPWTNFALTKKL